MEGGGGDALQLRGAETTCKGGGHGGSIGACGAVCTTMLFFSDDNMNASFHALEMSDVTLTN